MTTEQEHAELLDQQRTDESQWSRKPVQVEVRNAASQVVSFRLPMPEFLALADEVEREGVSISEYLRGAIALRMEARPPAHVIEVMATHLSDRSRAQFITHGREATEAIWDAIEPPRSVAML